MWGLGDELPDAPDIERMERTGLRAGEIPFDDDGIQCPVCDVICETIYQQTNGIIVGCENCVQAIDSAKWASRSG